MSKHVRRKSRNRTIPETKRGESCKEVNSYQGCEDKKKLFFGLSN